MGRPAKRHMPFGITRTGAYDRLRAEPGRVYLELWMIADQDNRAPRDPEDIRAETGRKIGPGVIEKCIRKIIASGLAIDEGSTLLLLEPKEVRGRTRAGAKRDPHQTHDSTTSEVHQRYIRTTSEVHQNHIRGTSEVSAPSDSEGLAESFGTVDRERDREGDGDRDTGTETPPPPTLSEGAESEPSPDSPAWLIDEVKRLDRACRNGKHPCSEGPSVRDVEWHLLGRFDPPEIVRDAMRDLAMTLSYEPNSTSPPIGEGRVLHVLRGYCTTAQRRRVRRNGSAVAEASVIPLGPPPEEDATGFIVDGPTWLEGAT